MSIMIKVLEAGNNVRGFVKEKELLLAVHTLGLGKNFLSFNSVITDKTAKDLTIFSPILIIPGVLERGSNKYL